MARPTPPSSDDASRRQIGVGGFTISARARELVLQVLESNRLTAGPMMAAFEEKIAALHGCAHGLMCNSGTSALQIAIAALRERHGWWDGDEILVPAITFIATSNAVIFNGMRPVFVDVEPAYYTIDPARIEAHVTDRTRAILPVHVGGLPCDMDPILAIAAKHGLRIIEDSAETMFAKYRGRPVGSFSDVACFSTYAAHPITTGVGGLCTTNDADLLVALRSLVNHGRDPVYIRIDDDRDRKGEALMEIVRKRFSFSRLGFSFRATELEAALGLAQLEEHEALWNRRKEIAARLQAGLAPYADRLRLPALRPETDHAWMFFPLTIVDPGLERDTLVCHLEERSVETRDLLPLLNQPVYRERFGELESRYPVAANVNTRSFYIGCHPEMTDDDVAHVVRTFASFFDGRGRS